MIPVYGGGLAPLPGWETCRVCRRKHRPEQRYRRKEHRVKARQEAQGQDKTRPDVRAVVHVFPGSMDGAQRSALVSALRQKGFVPSFHEIVPPGGPQPSADQWLARAEAERLKIGEQHGGLPVILLGRGYGAPVAGALLHRLPGHFAGAIFWNIPVLSPLRRATLLTRLRWEKFRLGSDVPSRVLRSSSEPPPIVGQAIAALELGRRISACRLDTLGKVLPILNIDRDEYSAFSSTTSRPYRTLDLNDLNQDINAVIAEWIVEIIEGQRSDYQGRLTGP